METKRYIYAGAGGAAIGVLLALLFLKTFKKSKTLKLLDEVAEAAKQTSDPALQKELVDAGDDLSRNTPIEIGVAAGAGLILGVTVGLLTKSVPIGLAAGVVGVLGALYFAHSGDISRAEFLIKKSEIGNENFHINPQEPEKTYPGNVNTMQHGSEIDPGKAIANTGKTSATGEPPKATQKLNPNAVKISGAYSTVQDKTFVNPNASNKKAGSGIIGAIGKSAEKSASQRKKGSYAK